MKNSKLEANVMIIINALREIIEIFSGPFLTAYFIKTSTETIIDLSIYNILSYVILIISSLIVGYIIKNKLKIASFRLGVMTNFIYILSIILLKENIIDYLWLLAILYGFSSSFYYLPFNLFLTNKIDNEGRTKYEVTKKIVSSIISILVPILLGAFITVTNYILTAIVILVISFVQILLSFVLKPIKESDNKFKLKEGYNVIKKDSNAKKMMIVEFLVGLSINYSALSIITTILIYNAFNTDLNLGIITSFSYVLQLVLAYFYGKCFKNKNDSKVILVCSIIPIISLGIFLMAKNNITILIYNMCYSIFINLLGMIRMIRLYNVANSKEINGTNQVEFWVIREISINLGRITSYVLLLIAGMFKNILALNLVMIILTLSILVFSNILTNVERLNEN